MFNKKIKSTGDTFSTYMLQGANVKVKLYLDAVFKNINARVGKYNFSLALFYGL